MATAKNAANGRSGVRLVVVESPSKAKTISGFLGDGYIVESSVGHIRDLPRGAADVPAKYKGEPWARLGVNTENGLRAAVRHLAGEEGPGREAEVAAGRRRRALPRHRRGPRGRGHRLAPARDAEAQGPGQADGLPRDHPAPRSGPPPITPREIDDNLVDAQETRRILDRLYGYEVSPVLWKKVMPKLSAGRVQSVATRIIVQRERERMAFRAGSYWGLDASMVPAAISGEGAEPFRTALNSVDGTPAGHRAGLRRRDRGRSRPARTCCCSTRTARARWPPQLQGGTATVVSVEEKPYTRKPVPAVHDLDAAAGGRPQARLQLRAHDAHRAAAVRVRLHHLHANRLDHAERHRAGGGPVAGPRAVRPGLRAGGAAAVHPQGQERPGGARGDPPGRGELPHPRPGRLRRLSTATSSGCTS